MIYTHTLDTFRLSSKWVCTLVQMGFTTWTWMITKAPTSSSKTLEFTVSLPADAVISRAWFSAEMGSPLSGAAYQTLNGVSIPSSGELDLEGINAETTSFTANFSFKANGRIIEEEGEHSSVLTFGNPTLNIEYTSEMEGAESVDPDSPGNIDRPGDYVGVPRLLDANLGEVCRLEVSKVSLNLKLRSLSTATVRVEPNQPEVKVRDFLEIFDPTNTVGIFRVASVEQDYGGGTGQLVRLEHAFCTLSDSIAVGVPGMAGSFRSVIATLLDAQTVKHWVLGEVDFPDEYEVVYAHGYENLLEVINKLTKMLPEGYAWEFDTLHYPWTMHFRKLPDDVFCECRLGRNLSKATLTLDTSSLCTRLYPFGAGEGEDRINLATLTGALFQDADTAGTWGIVTRTFTNEEIFDSLTLQDVATRYLERNKNPIVSLTLDAMALYPVTGEPLDRFKLGLKCRLPLPSYGVVMDERVIEINYPDVYGTPDKATLLLANRQRNAADEIAELIREASNSKLIGGTVVTEEIKSGSSGITTANAKVVYFDIEEYGNLLAAKVRYTALVSSTGNTARCMVHVDGTEISGASTMPLPIDIFRYLATDENGIPTVGQHWVRFTPTTGGTVSHSVQATVTLKTIEAK